MNISEAATEGVLWKKTVVKKICNINKKVAALQLYLKETPTQMFSSEYYEDFKNIYFGEHLLTVASEFLKQLQNSGEQWLLFLLQITY